MKYTPGTLFRCRSISHLYNKSGLHRTASTYRYGDRLETCPDLQSVYVICKDGSVQAIMDPGRPIGWEIGDGWYRLTQVGFEPVCCDVEILGRADTIPDGSGSIGSKVSLVYSREVAFEAASQDAQAIGGEDDEDEDEVTSSISFNLQC